MKRIVYISGPMSGFPGFNFQEFNRVAKLIRLNGYHVINPAEFGIVDGWKWEDYLRKDIQELTNANIIATLDGWQGSRGAILEVFIANNLKIPVVEYEKLLKDGYDEPM